MHGPEIARRESDGDRAEAVADACEPDAIGWSATGRRRRRPETVEGIRLAAHADEAGRAGGKLDAALREQDRGTESGHDFFAAWQNWNSGFAGFGRVDDGLSEALASRRGLGRSILAAYGDAVVPAIIEAIGRVVRRAENRVPRAGKDRLAISWPTDSLASVESGRQGFINPDTGYVNHG